MRNKNEIKIASATIKLNHPALAKDKIIATTNNKKSPSAIILTFLDKVLIKKIDNNTGINIANAAP